MVHLAAQKRLGADLRIRLTCATAHARWRARGQQRKKSPMTMVPRHNAAFTGLLKGPKPTSRNGEEATPRSKCQFKGFHATLPSFFSLLSLPAYQSWKEGRGEKKTATLTTFYLPTSSCIVVTR
jgi:hypothetical protein